MVLSELKKLVIDDIIDIISQSKPITFDDIVLCNIIENRKNTNIFKVEVYYIDGDKINQIFLTSEKFIYTRLFNSMLYNNDKIFYKKAFESKDTYFFKEDADDNKINHIYFIHNDYLVAEVKWNNNTMIDYLTMSELVINNTNQNINFIKDSKC